MLQVVIPGIRNGHMFRAGNNLVMGTVAYISGMDTNGMYILKKPADQTAAALAVYPFIKYSFRSDLTDYGVATAGAGEVIASNDPLIAFEGGEYITDRFMSNANGAGPSVGSHTSGAAFYSAQLLGDTAAAYRLVTDTAAYTEGLGKMVYLWPSTTAGYEGYLRMSTNNPASYKEKTNRNFMLVKAFSRGSQGFGGNKVWFRIVAKEAYSGRYNTGVATAAYYNVATTLAAR